MNVAHLNAVLAIARYGSIRAAARHLGLSQPSLSKSLRQLEHYLDTALFERHSSGITLTDAGKAYLRHAEAALNELRRGKDEVNRIAKGRGGSVSIGMSAAPSLLFLADVIKDFREYYPTVKLNIVAGNFPALQTDLQSKRIEFSISPRPSFDLGPEYLTESLFVGHRAIYCRKNHPLLGARKLADLVQAEWIITGATGTARAEYDDIFEQYGLVPPVPVIQCEYTTALIALLADTDLLAMLPKQWIESNVTQGLLSQINVEETLVSGMDICYIKSTTLELSPAAQYLMTLIRRYSEQYVFSMKNNGELSSRLSRPSND